MTFSTSVKCTEIHKVFQLRPYFARSPDNGDVTWNRKPWVAPTSTWCRMSRDELHFSRVFFLPFFFQPTNVQSTKPKALRLSLAARDLTELRWEVWQVKYCGRTCRLRPFASVFNKSQKKRQPERRDEILPFSLQLHFYFLRKFFLQDIRIPRKKCDTQICIFRPTLNLY